MRDQPAEPELQAVRNAVQSGEKIQAIKLYREVTGADLNKVKQYVDRLASEQTNADPSKPESMTARSFIVGLGGTHNTMGRTAGGRAI
jgi:ribosomal protein L7/L12